MKLPDSDAPLCLSGKHPFRTEEDARGALQGARHLRATNGPGYRLNCVEQDYYRCTVPGCGWWHLSSTKGPRRRAEFANRGKRQVRRRR